jgi:hypothetical protein
LPLSLYGVTTRCLIWVGDHRALALALEHGGRGRATIVHSDIGPFRYFAIGWRPADGRDFECATYTVVRRSDRPGLDADRAMEVFEQVLLEAPSRVLERPGHGRRRVRTPATSQGEHDVSKTTRLTTFLPGFGGFHGTQWENLFPYSLEMRADRFALEEGGHGLDAAAYSEILRETSSASRFFKSLAERFCRRFDAETSTWLGFELDLAFRELDGRTGPGSTTDHILATMPVGNARKLLELSAREDHRRFVEGIRDRFAPYDGLVPDSDDAVQQWLAQPIEGWAGRRSAGSVG